VSAVLSTVWCGQCIAEHRPRPGRLGRVERGFLRGNTWSDQAVVWMPSALYSRRRFRPERRDVAQFEVLSDPHWRLRPPDPPDVLPAWCPVHGRGVVPTAEVLAGRGSMTLTLSAIAP
jgi:hypothetical protein